MILTALQIHHLRNIASARLALHPQLNIFWGANGSGKTSLLESVYLLSTGHSFRTREISPLISSGQASLTVFAATSTDESISIQKSSSAPTQVKLNKQPCYSSSELARFLPCQVFYQDIFQIIDAGPGVRRSLLDWGLFHVKQSYLGLWKDYRRVLKQRNALLRQRAQPSQFVPWDSLLASLAAELDAMRAAYFVAWSESFAQLLPQLTDEQCIIKYYKGWDRKNTGKDLATILADQLWADMERQFTQSGPHQADIYFELPFLKAKQSLSRGQQKIILIALKLAQAQLLTKPCVYLLDDIAAELDAVHLRRLFNCIGQIKGQFLLTTLELPQFDNNQDLTIFSIAEGNLSVVSRETAPV